MIDLERPVVEIVQLEVNRLATKPTVRFLGGDLGPHPLPRAASSMALLLTHLPSLDPPTL